MNTLASRVSRLIAGSVHAAVDALENVAPEVVMEQAIREIDAAITEVRAELGIAIAAGHAATKQLANNSDKHSALADQIIAALEVGREDLAKVAISKQMDLEAQIPVLETAIADAGEREKELEGYINALTGKRADMRDELARYRERQKEQPENTIIDASGKPSSAHAVNQAVDSATAAFERVAGTYASGSSDLKTAGQMAELKDLARNTEIEKRLAAMKAGQ